MKNELKENKYLVLTLVVLIAVVILTPILYKQLNSTETGTNKTNLESVNGGNNQVINKDDASQNNNTNQTIPSEKPVDNQNVNFDNNSTPNSTVNNDIDNNVNNNNGTNENINSSTNKPKSEEDVISYFSETENFVTTYSSEPMTDSLKTKLKNSFTTIVDFLFYDKPIKGYTFKELTLSAKLKVCKIALSIDQKIDSYFPSYKDTIKNGFTSLKTKVVSMYLTLTSKACEVVGSNVCTQARSDFKNMKEVLKLDLEFIKEIAGNSKEAISEWYQSIR